MAYCTEADLNTRISALGVDLRAEHDAGAVDQSLELAAADTDGWLRMKYTATQLAASTWVASKNIILASYHLCWLRLNEVPSVLVGLRDEILHEFQLISEGKKMIPDVALSSTSAPAVINQEVRLDSRPSLWTDTSRSTTQTTSPPNRRASLPFRRPPIG